MSSILTLVLATKRGNKKGNAIIIGFENKRGHVVVSKLDKFTIKD